jgi:hypothetical protein
MADWAGTQDSIENFPHFPYAPYDPEVDYYLHSRIAGMGSGTMVPFEYSGWRDEERASDIGT